MSSLRLAFVIRSTYNQLSSRDNLQKWGLVEDAMCRLLVEPRHCIMCLAIAQMPLPMVAVSGNITKSFEKCMGLQKQQFPRQTHAQLLISKRFISFTRASHTSAKRNVKCPALPQVLVENGKKPDTVLVSTHAIILAELTLPWRTDFYVAMHSRRKSKQIYRWT